MVQMRIGKGIFLAGAAVLASFSTSPPAGAQTAPTHHYSLEAGTLGDALQAVSRLSGREIVFSSEAVIDLRAPSLNGTYSADEAVRRLLSGSGLKAQYRKDAILIGGRSEGPDEAEAAPAPDILVTTSRIRGAPSASPVIVTAREQIEEAGVSNLGAFARTLPQNFSGGQNPGVAGNPGQSENTNSSSAMNLRGLGPDATLTLVNGHRVAYDAVSQGVDISAVPLLAIDRVEVVTDGASALYGSDAVGGVANVLLQRDHQGTTVSARLGAATDGGDVERQVSAITGARWESGGFMVAGDYLDTSPILAGQRSYTRNMDGSATLLPGQEQISAVVAAHQRLGDTLTFEFDGQFSNRDSGTCNPYFSTSDCRTNGNDIDRRVRSFSVTPSLHAAIAGDWDGRLSYTHGESRTSVHTAAYTAGSITGRYYPKYTNSIDAFEAGLEGPLFQLPGGEARLALGGGFRTVTLDVDSRQTVGGATTQTYLFSQSRDTYYAYGEVLLPLVGQNNRMPGLERLLVSGAVRYEKNQGFGDLATPKLGLVYAPSRDLSLSVSWGRSFKAPTLYQTGQPPEAFLVPGTLFTPPGPDGAPVIMLSGGRPDIRPEKARTWTVKANLAPAWLPGFKAEVSLFDIRYRDRVVTPIANILSAFSPQYASLIQPYPSEQQVLDLIGSLPAGLINQTGAPYVPGDVTAIVDYRLRNAARQSLRGIDMALGYAFDLGQRDRIELDGSASYLESSQKLGEGMPSEERAGRIFNPPHWRGRGSLAWTHDNLRLGAIASYIGGTLDDRIAQRAKIPSFTTLDVIARIRTLDESGPFADIEVMFAAMNLFNEKPAIIRVSDPASFTYDSTNYSSVGRTVNLTLTKSW